MAFLFRSHLTGFSNKVVIDFVEIWKLKNIAG